MRERDERATALAKEGELSKACSALLDEPLVPAAVVSLATISSTSLVQDALLFFAFRHCGLAAGPFFYEKPETLPLSNTFL